jgi:predicted ATPase
MKIDIHTHTTKCKTGDPDTREVTPDAFCEAVLSGDVGIVAITNHNVFDLEQFRKIEQRMSGDAQVWPGVELDIDQDGEPGHLLVIVSPGKCDAFDERLRGLTAGATADTFTAPIEDVVNAFDSLGPLYVAHYRQKKPNISDETLTDLLGKTASPARVIREVANAISAGIYVSHGYPSIYGSDVRDWASYATDAEQLPDLRLPVDSFDHFCLLLEKDQNTINTALDQKTSELLALFPFEDGTLLSLRVFNDINVVFGPKGTGKSCVLDAIARHYSEQGVDANVYRATGDQLEQMFDLSAKEFSVDLGDLGLSGCSEDFSRIRGASEGSATSITDFKRHFSSKKTNRNAKKILLKEMDPEAEDTARAVFESASDAEETVKEFLDFLAENSVVEDEMSADDMDAVSEALSQLLNRLEERAWEEFMAWKSVSLLNSAIDIFRQEVARKTGSAAKPSTTGFRDYAINRIEIAAAGQRIRKNVCTPLGKQTAEVGSLGKDKGVLELWTVLAIQDGDLTDSNFGALTKVKKSAQKKVAKTLAKIAAHAFSGELFQLVSDLNEIDDGGEIKSLEDLIVVYRHFALDGTGYTPSSGESSMVMLQAELDTERDVYILDEPEKSLGNEYISEVIVPMIRERARVGKKLVIATHDANIAVRTLPYCSVYRHHGSGGYQTYVGNPFSNDLVNLGDSEDRIDWREVSMRTLEGGAEAFGERRRIYGQD